MTVPDSDALFAALEGTWPSQSRSVTGGWTIRDGAGGGKRVSAATTADEGADIAVAETAMRALAQTPLFMLREGQTGLAQRLDARGYRCVDPTVIYTAEISTIAQEPPAISLYPVWPPLAIMCGIWAEGGIGPARLKVMARCHGPKAGLIARSDDRAAGAAFCAIHDGIAMVHAVEVTPALRRKGVARNILQGAAFWAQGQGARWLALAVTEGNGPARALYDALGMQVVTRYSYRQKED
ncbi:GNAT family N-acetyltransferase [Roseinatronobacter alkalisoli]|uniref:GNAT family N-acetyltransferase n=1 Tax=Roseinatronobacter alkalisoli TaxID=3028235 RepID=A0ABT5TD01_9RHOB|nr:GNAT family N-acetyltransferase [Roseinatronobacter sp. HJB301]MDD7972575.1 GNAT family N-acetyltransferase [Roseinatronobacter sp. HJB301]